MAKKVRKAVMDASTEMHLDLFVMFVHIPQGRGSSLSAWDARDLVHCGPR